MTRTWNIDYPNDTDGEYTADRLEVSGGALVFSVWDDDYEEYVAEYALAPGLWVSVSLEE